MSRCNLSLKKRVTNDYRYQDPIIGKFINMLMKEGKKSVAEKIVYEAISAVEEDLSQKYGTIQAGFLALVNLVSSDFILKTRRVGGANYQVPTPLSTDKKLINGLSNLKLSFLKSPGRTSSEKLTEELKAIMIGKGYAIKKKEDDDKAVEAKKAYAHLA
jgi:small subunit ribosomal protein S7